MENKLPYYEKCLLYFKGEATPALEKEVLEAKENDSESAQIYEETKLLFEGFRIQEKHKLAKELFQNKSQGTFTFLKLALAAMLMMTSLFAYLALSKSYFPDFKTHTSVLMSPNEVEQILSPQEKAYKLFIEGKGKYDTQEFEEAIQLFEESLIIPNLRNQLKEAIQWHQCVAYMRTGDYEKARSIFEELDSLQNPKFQVGFLSKTKIRFQLFLNSFF